MLVSVSIATCLQICLSDEAVKPSSLNPISLRLITINIQFVVATHLVHTWHRLKILFFQLRFLEKKFQLSHSNFSQDFQKLLEISKTFCKIVTPFLRLSAYADMGWAAPVAVRNCGNHCTHRPQTHSEGGWPVGRQFGRCRPCQESVMPGPTPPDIHTVIDPQIVRQGVRLSKRRSTYSRY